MSLNPLGSEWSSLELNGLSIVGLSNGTVLALSEAVTAGGDSALLGQIIVPDQFSIADPFLIRTVGIGTLGAAVAAPLSSGRFAVAWNYNTDYLGAFKLESQSFGSSGIAESGIFEIVGASYPVIAPLRQGGYAIGYQHEGLKSVVIGATGDAGQAVEISAAGYSQSIATLGGGGYVTVVQSSPTISSTVITAYLRGPDGQLSVKPVATFEGVGDSLEVIPLANGNFAVVWLDHSGAGNSVRARIFNSQGDAVGAEKTLYQNVSGAREQLTVKALPGGGFAAAFVQRGVETDVYLGIYSDDGEIVASPQAIGHTTVGSQTDPMIAVLRDGRYVVSWRHQDDGSTHFQTYDPRTKGITLAGDDARDQYIGTRFSDVIKGLGGADRLSGEGGNDVLDGGAGFDLMFGGSGNDVYYVSDNGDRVIESRNHGFDYVIASISYVLPSDSEIEKISATGAAGLALYGNGFANFIVGNKGSNKLDGGFGHDTLQGGNGNDKLYGGSGSDILYGGAGNDYLKGGSGRDTFVFDARPSKTANVDRIHDFVPSDDTFRLDNAVFTRLGFGTTSKPRKLDADMFVKGAQAKDREDRIVYDKDTGALYYDADGSGTKFKQVKIATLSKNLKLTHNDFFVI